MPYKLNPKLVPLLIKEESTGELIAGVMQSRPGYINLQLDDGVIVVVDEADLGIKLGKNSTGKLYFDKEGNYLNASLSKPRKPEKSVQKGCITAPQPPKFN